MSPVSPHAGGIHPDVLTCPCRISLGNHEASTGSGPTLHKDVTNPKVPGASLLEGPRLTLLHPQMFAHHHQRTCQDGDLSSATDLQEGHGPSSARIPHRHQSASNSVMDPDLNFATLAFLGWSVNIFNMISIYPAVDPEHPIHQLFLPHPTLEPFLADVLPTFLNE